MINARQARELVEQSSARMEKRLEQIGEKIEEAAGLGKTELWLFDSLPYHKEFEVVEISYRNPDFTPIQRLIKKELERLGYSFKIEQREVTIGGGLGSLDEPSRIEKHPYIRVTW
jgi:hypothetical protein